MYRKSKKVVSFIISVAFLWNLMGLVSYAEVNGGNNFENATLITSNKINLNLCLKNSYFKFIPSQSTTYTIQTLNDVQNGKDAAPDTFGRLYDQNYQIITTGINDSCDPKGYDATDGQDSGGGGNDFLFTCKLEARQTYYLYVQDVFEPGSQPYNTCDLQITGGGLLSPPDISIDNAATKLSYRAGQTISVSGTVNDANHDNVTISASIGEKSQSTVVTGGVGAWTLSWDIDSLGISEGTYQNIVFTANDGTAIGPSSATHTGDIVVDKTKPSAPTEVSVTPVGGTVVANTLNNTNTNLTGTATIVAAQAAGGKAELYVNGSLKATDNSITASDTQVNFDLGQSTSAGLQAAVGAGGIVIVKLYDEVGNSEVSSVGNPTLNVDYAAAVLSAESANNETTTTATLNFTSNEVGTYYYVVYADGDAAPNAATIKAQGGAVSKGTAAAKAAANVVSLSGLNASTSYKAYVIVEDETKNLSAVSTIAFSTTAPEPTYGVTINVKKDNAPWTDHGKTYKLVKSGSDYTDLSAVPNGTYDVYEAASDTGVDVTVSSAAASATVDYYTVTVTKGTGIDSVSGSGTFLKGANASIDAVVSAGYTWSNWTQTTGGAEVSTVKSYSISNITTAHSYTANATESTYGVTINVKKDNTAWTDHGKTYKLVKSGSDYTNLSAVPNGTYTVYEGTIKTGVNVTVSNAAASATVDYYTVALTKGTGIDSVSGNGTYLKGANASIDASVNPGYTWSNWTQTTGGAAVSAEESYGITNITAAHSYTANAVEKTYGVTITVNKDNAAWAGHGKTYKLVKSKVDYTNLTAVPNGTYDVYEGSSDTGVDVTVSNAAASATVDYYTVTVTKGTGIDSVSGNGTYLKGANASIDAVVSAGYTWSNWTQTTGGAEVSTVKSYSISNITTAHSYTANATESTYGVTINVKKDNTAWTDHGKTYKLVKSGNDYTNLTAVPNGTYAVYEGTNDTGVNVTVSNAAASATVDYYTVALTKGTGIDSVTGNGIYLKGANASIDATVNPGYTWSNWTQTTGGAVVSAEESYGITNITAVHSYTANALEKTYGVTINVNKDNAAWAGHGKTYKLVKSKVDYTNLTAVPNGTYDVYEGTSDTGVDVTVSNATASATVDYYTVTVTKGTGIDSVSGSGTFLKGANASIDATVSPGYTWSEWTQTTGGAAVSSVKNYSITNIAATQSYTANAVESTYGVTINVKKDNTAWTDHGKTYKLVKSGSDYTNLTAVPNGTYNVYEAAINTGVNVTVSNAATSATVDYYTVALTKGTGIDSVSGNGTYLKGANATIDATVNPGYTWSNWTKTTGGAAVSAEKNYSITNIAAAHSYTANTVEKTYGVTITVNKDNAAWAGHGKSYKLVKSGSDYTNLTAVPNGTYDVYEGTNDTGVNVTVSNAAASATVNYYTVSFLVNNTGTASGSTISATAGGLPITSGLTVLAGKSVTITTVGAGATSYTYAWTGAGTSAQTTAAFTISSLSGTINATCTVTGTTYSGGGGSGSSSGSASSGSSSGASVIVNGKTQDAGNASNVKEGDRTVTVVTVDSAKLQEILDTQSENPTVIIPITANTNAAAGVLTGQMIKSMEAKKTTVVLKTEDSTYTLPASEINIDAVSKQLGQSVALSDIKVQVEIAKPAADTVKIVENAAAASGCSIVVPAVDFSIRCSYNGKTVDVSSFHAYIERMVAIPTGVDPKKITTGIVVSSDGKTRHVPTKVTEIGGKHYAVINSLTNSTYTVVWHPIEFSDLTKHWARDAINNMGSRMVMDGIGNNTFAPDRDITRAEFAAIIVRALGLAPGSGTNQFHDVKATDWFCGYVQTASQYGIINGYSEKTFAPSDKITREQAMTMIARAIKITGMGSSLTDSEINSALAAYTDAADLATYAKSSIAACLKTGVVSGTGNNMLSPKNNITRAEVAVIVEKLLIKSELI